MRALSQQEWADIMGRFVSRVARAAQDAYEEMHNTSDQITKEPVRAEPFVSMVCDGVLGFLTTLNALNKREVEAGAGVDEFDVIELFTHELFMRLEGMGYPTTTIDENMDPEAFKKANEAVDAAYSTPEGVTKQ